MTNLFDVGDVQLGEAVQTISENNYICAAEVTKGQVVYAYAHVANALPTIAPATDALKTCVGVAMKSGAIGASIPVLEIGKVVVTVGAGGIVVGEPIEAAASGCVEDGETAGCVIGKACQTATSGDTGLVFINCSSG